MSLNPHKLKVMEHAYIEKKKEDNELQNIYAHLTGKYVLEALFASVGNMLSKKGTNAYEYPKQPIKAFDYRTEEEIKQDTIRQFKQEQENARKAWKNAHK